MLLIVCHLKFGGQEGRPWCASTALAPSPPHPPPQAQHVHLMSGGLASLPTGPQHYSEAPGKVAKDVPWTLAQACLSMGLSIFLA